MQRDMAAAILVGGTELSVFAFGGEATESHVLARDRATAARILAAAAEVATATLGAEEPRD